MLSDFEGDPIELNLTQDIVVKALQLQEGNHIISSMKLTSGDRMLAFTLDNANDSVHALLHNNDIQLALQIHQQYFHIYKPQKYTHADVHTAFLFSLAMLRKQHIKANWGTKNTQGY